MFQVGEYVVYKKDVCCIQEKNKKDGIEYYKLIPIDDSSLTIEIPINNANLLLRKPISKIEVKKLILEIPTIPIIETEDKMLETEYRKLISSGKKEDLIKIIKTTYLRNKNRMENKKKISDKDNQYFEKAEKLLYNECSIALEMPFDETKNYIVEQVEKLMSK